MPHPKYAKNMLDKYQTKCMQDKRDGDAMIDLMKPPLMFIIPKKNHIINMSDIINPCRKLTMRQLIKL